MSCHFQSLFTLTDTRYPNIKPSIIERSGINSINKIVNYYYFLKIAWRKHNAKNSNSSIDSNSRSNYFEQIKGNERCKLLIIWKIVLSSQIKITLNLRKYFWSLISSKTFKAYLNRCFSWMEYILTRNAINLMLSCDIVENWTTSLSRH